MHFDKAINVFLAVALSGACATAAAEYPDKPVRLIVPFAPGGTTDIIARVVADQLGPILGQPVVVDNRSGAGGMLGASEIAKSAPDGYTLGIATVSTTAAVPAINSRVPYDPTTDFTSIINMAATPNVLAVNPTFQAKDFPSFLQLVKANPGKFSYASSGTGGIGHLQMELFKSLTNTFVTHIPYRGAGPALTDTISGQVPIIFDNLPSALPFIKDKRLLPIAVASQDRLPMLPGVPTFKELGLEPVNRMAYYGIHGPKNIPPAVVNKLNAAIRKALDMPATRKKIEETGSIVVGNTPEQFASQTKAEFAVYKRVVEQQKLKLD